MTMNTEERRNYAETQGEPAFDWNKFLVTAHLHSNHDWESAKELAGDWVTCATGNQCDLIPRHEKNGLFYRRHEPKDTQLAELGIKFFNAIKGRSVALARIWLEQIENRSSELLFDILDAGSNREDEE